MKLRSQLFSMNEMVWISICKKACLFICLESAQRVISFTHRDIFLLTCSGFKAENWLSAKKTKANKKEICFTKQMDNKCLTLNRFTKNCKDGAKWGQILSEESFIFLYLPRQVYDVEEYQKNLSAMIFIPTWGVNCRNVQEIP